MSNNSKFKIETLEITNDDNIAKYNFEKGKLYLISYNGEYAAYYSDKAGFIRGPILARYSRYSDIHNIRFYYFITIIGNGYYTPGMPISIICSNPYGLEFTKL